MRKAEGVDGVYVWKCKSRGHLFYARKKGFGCIPCRYCKSESTWMSFRTIEEAEANAKKVRERREAKLANTCGAACMTTATAAEKFGVDRMKVIEWFAKGMIPGHHVNKMNVHIYAHATPPDNSPLASAKRKLERAVVKSMKHVVLTVEEATALIRLERFL